MIFVLPILISLMSTAAIEAFSNSNSNSNNSNSNINNSQLTRRRSSLSSPSLPQLEVQRSCSSSALSAHHGFHTNHHDSLVYTSSLVRSSSVPTLSRISRTHSNNNGNMNGNGRKRSSSNCGPLFLSPMDLVHFSSAISAKIQAKKGAAGLMQKVAGKAAIASASVAAVDTAAAASTVATSAAMITTAAAATATAAATDTAMGTAAAHAAATATTTVSESAHQLVVATATAIASPDKEAEFLSDSSFALCEYPTFLPDLKTNKLRIRVAQVLGRILIIDISLLPGHTFHPEELAIQLFLLGASLQPIIRSFKLLRKIKEVQCNKEGCIIDFDDLEDDEEFGDVESANAVVDGDGHGRLEYSFGTGGTGTGDGNDDGGVSVQCNAEGCTIDFDDDLEYVADSAVVTDGDDDGDMNGSILECTLTGEDGGFECMMAITDTTTDPIIENQYETKNYDQHPDHYDPNLMTSSSFDDVIVHNIVSIPATTAPKVMVK